MINKPTDNFKPNKDDILHAAKNLGIQQNVSFRIYDEKTGELISEHAGHNNATNMLITGIGHYLLGEGIYNQGYDMLHRYVPLYISLGTMGLLNQDEDSEGLPAGVGVIEADAEDEATNEALKHFHDLEAQLDRILNGFYAIYPDTHEFIYDKYGDKIHIPGIIDLEQMLKKEASCPYCAEQGATAIMPDKCINCMFPDKQVAIDRICNGYYIIYDESVGGYDPDVHYDPVVDNDNKAIWVKGLTELKHDYAEAELEYEQAYEDLEGIRFDKYLDQVPGFGSDGSSDAETADVNYRKYLGLGNEFRNRPDSTKTIDCELISPTFLRTEISYRELVPEDKAELQNTVDVIFSAMISTGALKQFREPGRDYVFITEAGLWASPEWSDSGENGLLAGYRIAPPNRENWYMQAKNVPEELIPEGKTAYDVALENRNILKQNILKVGINQVVQVVWKLQIGGVEQFEGMRDLFTVKKYRESAGLIFGHIPWPPGPSPDPPTPDPPEPEPQGPFMTTYFEDGTLIINESIPQRYDDIAVHGEVVLEMPPWDGETVDYVADWNGEDPLGIPWNDTTQETGYIAWEITSVIIGSRIRPVSTAYWFYRLLNCKTFDLHWLDTSNTTDMAHMFDTSCDNDEDINLDLTSFDTSSVITMEGMFSNCGVVGIDMTSFDTQRLSDMGYMFYHCPRLLSIDMNTFDTRNVLNMHFMFAECPSITNIIVSPLFVVDQIPEIVGEYDSEGMFCECVNIVGGSGTTYDSDYTDKQRAKIDGGSDDPGYFTATT